MSDLLDLRFLTALAINTVRDPQEGAKEVLRLAPPRNALWLAFALMIVTSLGMGEIVAMIVPTPEGTADVGPLTGQSSLTLGLMQAGFLFLTVFAIAHIGQLFGGTGQFDQALALITWLQFVFFLIQLVQLVLLIFAPVLALIVTTLAIGLFFWLLVNFITVLHGFTSVGMVFVMTIVSFISILFVISLILTVLGLTLDPASMPQ